MRRWLFNLATAVSLGLCVATVALCIRSKHRWDSWELPLPGEYSTLESLPGRLEFSYVTSHQPAPLAGLPRAGFVFTDNGAIFPLPIAIENPRVYSGLVIGAPDWFLIACTSILPLIWLWRWWRDGRRPAGLCPTCGYDLRATPDRCPECGAVPPVPPVPRGGSAG